MRAWHVPVQIIGEEKVIGGYLSLRQLLYLIIAIGCGGVLAFLLPAPLWARFSVFGFVTVMGCLFAFLRLYNMGADVFVWRLFLWWKRPRRLTLKGKI